MKFYQNSKHFFSLVRIFKEILESIRFKSLKEVYAKGELFINLLKDIQDTKNLKKIIRKKKHRKFTSSGRLKMYLKIVKAKHMLVF